MGENNKSKDKAKAKPKAKTGLTQEEIMKYEIANELGLMDKVNLTGWRSLTAKESGRIGGLMSKRKRLLDGQLVDKINNS